MPADTINLDASSKDIFRKITSSIGNINKKPLVGFGVVGTKTLINFLLVLSAISPVFSLVANPTSGFLLMFPVDEVIHLDMSFEEASKFIVSAGTSSDKN